MHLPAPLRMLTMLAAMTMLSSVACTPANTSCDDPGVAALSCLALRLTEGVSSKIDRVSVFYEINTADGTLFTTRFDQSDHAPAKLPIDLAVVQPLNPPFTDPLIHVIVIASLGDSVVGTTSFGMAPPQAGTFKVSVPLVPVNQSLCFNGAADAGESDIDCGSIGTAFLSGKYSANVIPIRDRCLPCLSGSGCVINQDCISKSCNNSSFTCD